MFLFLLGQYVGIELQDQKVDIYLTLQKTASFFAVTESCKTSTRINSTVFS